MLSSYLYCQRKFFLQYVLKLVEIPKEVMVKGSVRHETYDQINKNEENLVKSIKTEHAEQDILTFYQDQYERLLRQSIGKYHDRLLQVNVNPIELFEKIHPLIQAEAESRAITVFTFKTKHDLEGQELWDKLIPKIISELRVEAPEIKLKGIIDQIEQYPEEYVPVELKTGKCPSEGVWPGHKVQIAIYAMLIEAKFNTKVREGFVKYLDAKTVRQVPINSFLKQEVRDLMAKVELIQKNNTLPDFTTNFNKCKPCSLKEKCYDKDIMANEMEKLLKNRDVLH